MQPPRPIPPTLNARRLGLMTRDAAIALVRPDSHVSRAEGLSPRSQVLIRANGAEVGEKAMWGRYSLLPARCKTRHPEVRAP